MKTQMMTSILAGAAVIGSIGYAIASVSLGDKLGTTESDIRAALTAQGYTVIEFEAEGGELEAEVMLDGQEMELVIDSASGIVVEMELENAEDDDGHDDD